MGQHAKRFEAVSAPKGSGLRTIVDQLKTVADTAEEWFDPNSPEVVNAMQRFEQGLALLSRAPDRPAEVEKKPRGRRSPTPKSAKDSENVGDTPEGQTGEGSEDAG